MRIHVILLFALSILTGIAEEAVAQTGEAIVLGAERTDTLVGLLRGKRVGLVVNQTSILVKTETHLLDALLTGGVDVKKIFAPEHGFRGTDDAGSRVVNSRDPKTGLPVISLYGKNFKPSGAQLSDLDVIVFDIQDVGARFYTYISTLHYVMEACAEHRTELVVLDRPNPNDFIDGPVRKTGYKSFVGMHPIPVLYGLTTGELAMMINGEGWLQARGKTCRLTVVSMLNWKHGDRYSLPVKPSPNLPNDQAVRLYPSLCLFEGTGISVGRGTTHPFQMLGFPDPQVGTFTFTPAPLAGFDSDPMYKDRPCYGLDLRQYPFDGGFTLHFVLDFYNRLHKNKRAFFARANWFDLLAGSNTLRLQIQDNLTEDEIRASWQNDLEAYKKIRKKYLLYPDYN